MQKSYFELDEFPEITTGRLLLNSVKFTDSHALFEVFKDENVANSLDIESLKTLEEAVGLVRLWQKHFRTRKRLRWAIRTRNNEEFIGSIGFRYVYKNAEAEIGFELHPKMQRQGIMTEAIEGVCEYGFSKLKLKAITAEVLENNLASITLLQKAGFRATSPTLDALSAKNHKIVYFKKSKPPVIAEL